MSVGEWQYAGLAEITGQIAVRRASMYRRFDVGVSFGFRVTALQCRFHSRYNGFGNFLKTAGFLRSFD